MLNFVALAIITTLFAPFVSAQGTPTSASDAPIPPIIWELTSLTPHNGTASEIPNPQRYTVQFLPDGKLAIGADCNRATGIYTIDGHALDVTLGVSTLALCPPDSQAEPFLDILEHVTRFTFDNDGHLLLDGEPGSLQFRATLQGVVWEWIDFRGGDNAVVAPKVPQHYTISFALDGKLAIRADCNRAIGVYTSDGVKLDLTIGGVTRALCPPESLMYEYLRFLGYASSHVFRDGNLYLALPADAGIMAFRARYVTPATPTPQSG